MIKTEGLVTEVKFGNDKKANIAVTINDGVLKLQQLATEKQVGDKIDKDVDIQELPKVEIEFFNTRSIDVLIGALEAIKKNYNPPPPIDPLDHLALAC